MSSFVNRAMFCPLCKTELVSGGDKRYKTLGDYVCDPNGEPPFRNTFVCPSEYCEAHKDKLFWSDEGEGYYGAYGKEYDWIDGNYQPFGSIHRSIHFQSSYHKEDKAFKTRWFIIHRKVSYKSDDYGNKTGKTVKYSLSIRSKHGGYIRYMPGLSMLVFGLKTFYYNRKHHLEGRPWKTRSGTSYWGDNIVSQINRGYWKDAEWWRKLETWWILTFHKSFVKEIGYKAK